MLASTSELADLLTRVARGDRVAFTIVYQSTSAKLYGTVLRILRRRELADEVLQEVYITIWNRAQDFDRTRGSPITWMVAIARNRALDEARRRQPVLLDDASALCDIADPNRLPEETVALNEGLKRLNTCLQALNEQHRTAVTLAYLDGWSREMLAQRLGQPVGTIKTWLHRSLKQLKDCLGS